MCIIQMPASASTSEWEAGDYTAEVFRLQQEQRAAASASGSDQRELEDRLLANPGWS